MIITATPLRISLAGGGTDIDFFYKKYGGMVVSTAIDKYIYVMVNERFDDDIRVSYSETEIVSDVEDLKHGIIRECLKYFGIKKGVEVVTIADIPSRGSGLGSSSSLTVGLLNALYRFKYPNPNSVFWSSYTLAQNAAMIEIERLGSPIGKQDHFIAAYGRTRKFEFRNDGSVLGYFPLDDETESKLAKNLLLYYTGITRDANSILSTVSKIDVEKEYLGIKEIAEELYESLFDGDSNIGEYLRKSWELKKKTARNISNIDIDSMYDTAIEYGATGGKICGAGGGGFLLLYVPDDKLKDVRNGMSKFRRLPINIGVEGSRVIY